MDYFVPPMTYRVLRTVSPSALPLIPADVNFHLPCSARLRVGAAQGGNRNHDETSTLLGEGEVA